MNKFVSKRGEIWKDIPKFEGVYQISNLGRARSLKKNRIYLLKNNVEKTFRSMKQAAKEIGGTGAGIKYSIKNNKPYKKRYLFYEIYIR